MPLRAEVQVNQDIVDRPGVPADLYDRYWWTELGDAGQVGTTAQIGLPKEERVVAAGAGVVVSAKDRDSGVRLLVRDIRSGNVLRRVDTELHFVRGLFVGQRLFWTGYAFRDVDEGVWMLNLDVVAEPEVVVARGKTLAAGQGRTLLSSSPSGQTIASVVSGGDRGYTDIINTETLQVHRLKGLAVSAVLDDVGMAIDEPPTDAPFGWFKAVRLETGETLWQFPTLEQRANHRQGAPAFVAVGTTFVAQYIRRRSDVEDESIIARFRASDGARTPLVVQQIGSEGPPILEILQDLVGPSSIAIGDAYSIGDMAFEGGKPVTVVNVETGAIQTEAFVLNPRFLCYPDYCLNYP